jgi:hypothetical protein
MNSAKLVESVEGLPRFIGYEYLQASPIPARGPHPTSSPTPSGSTTASTLATVISKTC